MLSADIDNIKIGSASFLRVEVRSTMENYLLDVDKLRVDRWFQSVVKDLKEILQIPNLTRLIDSESLLDEPFFRVIMKGLCGRLN